MAEKTKKVGVAIKRERQSDTKIVVVTGFKLRFDKPTGLIDILLEVAGQKGELVKLDPSVLISNLDVFKKYNAGVTVEPDDSSQKEDVLVSEHSHFANMLHCSNMGFRTETIFGVFSFHDWVEASQSATNQMVSIKSFDRVAAFGTPAFQKKFVLELILLVSELVEKQSRK